MGCKNVTSALDSLKRHRHARHVINRVLLLHILLQLQEGGSGRVAVAVEDGAAIDSWVGWRCGLTCDTCFGHDAEEAHMRVVLLEAYPIPEGAEIIDFRQCDIVGRLPRDVVA